MLEVEGGAWGRETGTWSQELGEAEGWRSWGAGDEAEALAATRLRVWGGAVGREVENEGGVMSPELVEGDCPAWDVAV